MIRPAALLLLALAPRALLAVPAGSWDLQVTGAPSGGWPGFIEIEPHGETARVRYIGRVGGPREISDAKVDGERVTFTRNEWFGRYEPVRHTFVVSGQGITGELVRENGQTLQVAGVPAPKLDRAAPRAWTEPRPLTNGRDFTGWALTAPGDPQSNWRMENGEIVAVKSGRDLCTTETFQDFRLSLEFFCPTGANSGIYLRGRYELQIEDDAPRAKPSLQTGGIYGWAGPAAPLPREANRWRRLEVTLVGRRVTVVLDGTPLYVDAEIPGITGGALDSDEAEPGPLMLQASHSKDGGIRFRNLSVQTARDSVAPP